MAITATQDWWRPTGRVRCRLAEVAALVGSRLPPTAADVVVTGVSQDSRLVRPGDLYAALPGARAHGADFAGDAAARGAVALLSDRPSPALPAAILVPDPRRVLGRVAAHLHGRPGRALDVYGVTGTNGKTSTVHLLHAGLVATGQVTALLSGLVHALPAGQRRAARSTPEAAELQALLAAAVEQGATAAAIEVSSHGLALHRVDGTHFRAGVFTNLGRDHLDLHGDMDSYYRAKASLVAPDRCDLAVVNVDDAWGRRLAGEARVPVVTFSTAGRDADWRAMDVVAGRDGTSLRAHGPEGSSVALRLRLLGRHQADNALAALAALAATGVDPARAAAGMSELTVVPGRLERVDEGQPFLALVDYVHNTSGQERLFPWLRGLTGGRLHVVVGATGGRDPGKRGPLGRTAGRFADTVVVTQESVHDDEADELIASVAAGARESDATVVVEPDRARAIEHAVSVATPGDVVVVAGRGADPTMVVGGQEVPFDDRRVLARALRRRPDRRHAAELADCVR